MDELGGPTLMLEIFYQSVVMTVICCDVVCWLSNICASDASGLNRLIHKTGTIIGQKLETSESVRDKSSLNKLLSIINNPSHPS